jgi:hypothetical protein
MILNLWISLKKVKLVNKLILVNRSPNNHHLLMVKKLTYNQHLNQTVNKRHNI